MFIAIIDSNMLTAIGLQQILQEIIPMAEVKLFGSFESLKEYDPKELAHCFVSSRIFFEHTQYFREQSRRTFVLVNGDLQIAGIRTLNVCQPEPLLIKAILSLHGHGHRPGAIHPGLDEQQTQGQPMQPESGLPSLLSARETEVALLLAKGLINKEVADRLNISLSTAITHRKNIMEKLKARSLADIIIYVVLNGLADVSEL